MKDVPVIILWYPEVYNIIYGNVHNLFFNEMLHFDFSCVYLNSYVGLFKKKSKKEILLAKYKKLNEEAYKLSHHDRKASDQKLKEANDILEEINALEEEA